MSKLMQRRHFLQTGAAAAASAASWRLWAAPSGGSGARFLLVFLRGGCDGLSALVPYAEPFYHEARPNIALPRPQDGPEGGSTRLDGRWALHPAMADALMPMYSGGEIAFLPFSGTGFVSRSHFQAQDWIEFGQAPDQARPDSRSGFLNRLVAELGGARRGGVSFTRNLPPALRGPVQVANSPVVLPKSAETSPAYENLLQALYAGHPLDGMVREGLGLRRQVSQELREEMQAASREALPPGGFALEAERIARLLRDQPEYSVGFMDVGGWDTHAGQGAERGALASRLDGLADGLKVLAHTLGPEWQRTVVVVMSEFGRTFRENGSRGTDHGHGSLMWVLGGGVRGGIRGEQAELRPASLHEDRDLPVLNEYRATLASVFGRLYGLGPEALGRVFPGLRRADPGVL